VHAQARSQGPSTVTGVLTQAPAGAIECTHKHAPRNPAPSLEFPQSPPKGQARTQGSSVVDGIPVNAPPRAEHARREPAP
jgi:hypothetical protein